MPRLSGPSMSGVSVTMSTEPRPTNHSRLVSEAHRKHARCRRIFEKCGAAILTFGLSLSARAADVTEAGRNVTEQKLAGACNPLSFADDKLVFDVQERLRLEERNNNFDFNDKVNSSTDALFLLQRFRLGMLVKPDGWLKLYAQGQDSREIDSKRDKVPFVLGAEGDDPFDLRQGYVELGDLNEFPLSAKVGRQELIYGDERLVGAFDWNNFSRTFDAVKLHYQNTEQRFWADAFAAHVVTIQGTGPQGNYGEDFNDANWNDTFAGVYGSTTKLAFQTTDAYFLYRNKESNNPLYQDDATPTSHTARPYDIKEEIYTIGLRMKSTPGKLNGFDYETEGAYQWGRDAGRIGTAYPNTINGGTMLDHSAFAAEGRLGYTWEDAAWKPRLGAEYSVASGDKNPNDHSDQSFLNLFPTNHKFYGYMDLFAWKNVHDPSLQLKLTPYQDKTDPWKNITVELDGHAFWLFTNQDTWYRANAVTTVRPLNAAALSANTYVGSEIDLIIGYQPMKWVKLQAGYSHFFAGDYVRETAAGTNGQDDADFAYLQTTITF